MKIFILLFIVNIKPYWISLEDYKTGISISKWVEENGGRRRTISKFLNSFSLFIPENEIQNLRKFSKDIKNVKEFKSFSKDFKEFDVSEFNYEDYQKVLKIDKVHQKGILGDNVKIGILDAGFDFNHPALKYISKPKYERLLYTHDFVSGDHIFIKFGANVFREINYNNFGSAYINSFDFKKFQNEVILFYSYSHDSIIYNKNLWKIYGCKVNELGEFTFSPKIIKRDTFAINPSFEIIGDTIFLSYKTKKIKWNINFLKISLSNFDLISDTTLLSSKNIINPEILNAFNKLNIFFIDTQGFKVIYSEDKGNTWNEKLIFEGNYINYKLRKDENGFIGIIVKGFPWERDTIFLFKIDSIYNSTFYKKIDIGTEGDIIEKNDTINLCYFDYENLIFSQYIDTIFLIKKEIDKGEFIHSPKFYFELNNLKLIYSKDGILFSSSLFFNSKVEIGFLYTDLIKSIDDVIIIRRRGDDVVTFEKEKDYDFSTFSHGARVLSVIGGMSYELTGVSPAAKFILARTERTKNIYGNEFENIIEEDFWVEGLEWLISKGAKIINSSLGYIGWWNKKDLDGKTAPSSIAASKAIKKDVLVVNAIGNLGENEYHKQIGIPDTTLHAPSDADSIISVGGIEINEDTIYVHEKSCYGPSADGRIKPDLVAPWKAKVAIIYFENGDTIKGYSYASGTSYSTAIITGICALALSAHPSWDARKILKYIKKTAIRLRYENSDTNSVSGWGYPDAEKFVFLEKPEISIPEEKVENDVLFPPYPNPSKYGYINFPYIIVEGESYVEFKIYDLSGNLIFEKNFENMPCGRHLFKWNLKDKNGKRVLPGNYIAVLKTSFNTSYQKFTIIK